MTKYKVCKKCAFVYTEKVLEEVHDGKCGRCGGERFADRTNKEDKDGNN